MRKVFINIRENTVPYSMALKNLEYSGESNQWQLRGGKNKTEVGGKEFNTILNRFCDTNLALNLRPGTPEQTMNKLKNQFQSLVD